MNVTTTHSGFGTCSTSTLLNPIQKYMLRLVLFGAGKTIFHKGTICEVIERHDQIRRLCPLVNEDLSEAAPKPFWVPRNAAIRATKSRDRRSIRDARRTLWKQPHYIGEPRPTVHPDDGLPLIPYVLETRTPSPESSGELSSMLLQTVPARGVMRAGIHLVGVRTNRRTLKGFFSRESVNKALGKMRTDSVMKVALMEVVFSRQSPTEISQIYCLPLGSLKVYATRLRKRIRAQNQPIKVSPFGGENM